MNRANGTITVTATNYKPNSRLGCGMPYGSEKRQPAVNLVDRIEVEFLVFVDVGEFGGVRRHSEREVLRQPLGSDNTRNALAHRRTTAASKLE